MLLPFIYLLFFLLFETSTSLKLDKHPPQTPGSQPDFKQSLLKAAPALRVKFRKLRQTQFGKGRAGEPNCPTNALCDYTTNKPGLPSKILMTCGNVILIAPFGSIKDNPSFIKFLAIPKEHVASAWSMTDKKFIPEAHQCVTKYLASPGATADLQKMMLAGCKGDKDCLMQHGKLSTAVKGLGRPLKLGDFVTYFHVPPGINHLHMHVALSDKKFRMFSDSHEDDRCMLANVVQQELLKAGPVPKDAGKVEGKLDGGKALFPTKMAAGPGMVKAGVPPSMAGPGKMGVARRWSESLLLDYGAMVS